MSEIVSEMDYLRSREQKLRDTNESTNNRVKWFGFGTTFLLISLWVWQVLYLRAYFRYVVIAARLQGLNAKRHANQTVFAADPSTSSRCENDTIRSRCHSTTFCQGVLKVSRSTRAAGLASGDTFEKRCRSGCSCMCKLGIGKSVQWKGQIYTNNAFELAMYTCLVSLFGGAIDQSQRLGASCSNFVKLIRGNGPGTTVLVMTFLVACLVFHHAL